MPAPPRRRAAASALLLSRSAGPSPRAAGRHADRTTCAGAWTRPCTTTRDDADPDADGHADDARAWWGSARRSTPFLPGRGPRSHDAPAAEAAADRPPAGRRHARPHRDAGPAHASRAAPFVMYGFNGQVPGPLIRVPQNATITVRFHNRIDLPSTVHWHGVRLDNRYDGVPGVTQDPVAAGRNLRLHGALPRRRHLLVPPARPGGHRAGDGTVRQHAGRLAGHGPTTRRSTASRSLVLTTCSINGDTPDPLRPGSARLRADGPGGQRAAGQRRAAAGRCTAKRGEVVRFYLTNAASSRTWNLSFGGAPIKVRGLRREPVRAGGAGAQRGAWPPPSATWSRCGSTGPGRYALVNAVQAINHFAGEFEPQVDTLGIVTVGADAGPPRLRRRVRDRCGTTPTCTARHRPLSRRTSARRPTYG